jgi:hypothetical protein
MNIITKTENWVLRQLTEDTVITSFESVDGELNDFLLNDAKKYLKSLLTATYLIRVDAYRNALLFYEKNSFKYMTDKDKHSETRAMYFDLKA